MRITPLGDSALIVQVAESFEASPDRTLAAVLQTMSRIEQEAIPGIIELAPAYTTVAVFFDPTHVIEAGAEVSGVFDWLGARIEEALSGKSMSQTLPQRKPIEIPVCYHPDFGFDLSDIASQTRRSIEEIVDLHSRAEYLVSCVGFTPGFPYLSGLPNELVVPRRSSPRKDVPAGSVAIGGKQSGIYPLNSPGGWNIIGRTPESIFDPAKNPPAVLRAGDRVRFRAIGLEEFEAFAS
jgi:inhibitor of KinA